MPGVTVINETRTGPGGPSDPPERQYFVAGITERGPIDRPVRVRNLNRFARAFGPRVTYGFLTDDLRTFFEEGGAIANVVRVVGPDAVASTGTSVDRAGTPVDTIEWNAIDPGAWGDGLDVIVAAGTTSGVKITVSTPDDPAEEVYDNLATPAAIVAAVNADSTLIVATNLASATVAPNNLPAVGTVALAGGDDDRDAVVAADFIAALDLFNLELGAGAAAIPGIPLSAGEVSDFAAWCASHRRIGLVHGDETADQAAAIDDVEDLVGIDDNEEQVGYFWPWVTIDDAGTVRTIPPTGYVAGVRARTIKKIGAWRPPAGEIAVAKYVTGPAAEVTRAEADVLYEAGVNPIRTIAGTTRLYGWRPLSDDLEQWSLLSYADLVHKLTVDGENLLEPYVFETIDGRGQLLGRIEGALIGMAGTIAAAGGLYARSDPATGEQVDPGYRVDMSENTLETAFLNEVHATLACRPSPAGTLIVLKIVKASATARL